MSSSSTFSCRAAPVALGPLETASHLSTSPPYCLHPSPPRPRCPRRPRRVLYPASRSKRLLPKEAPDQARRWLLVLSALLFLQIYTEEAHTCTELQSQCPDASVCYPLEADASTGAAWGWTGEEPWRVTTVGGASEAQLECVVA